MGKEALGKGLSRLRRGDGRGGRQGEGKLGDGGCAANDLPQMDPEARVEGRWVQKECPCHGACFSQRRSNTFKAVACFYFWCE